MINKKILIIGGTGALGRTLVRRYQHANELIVLSRDEHKQVNMRNMDWTSDSVRYKIGDVKDPDSLRNAIEEFEPEVIINAAAIKHVPVCEDNPFESVNVNIIGHQNLIQQIERSRHQIETLIFVSTDKACKPINVYGMSKAIAEKIYTEYANKTTRKVCIVRYGNVLESTGSVIPFFKSLLAADEPFLPITDFKMTRFLLTLDRATDLIEWAYNETASHGSIAVPKVKSFSIVDIANALIRSAGKHVELKEVGIRPGEKLHEEMISEEEWMRSLEFNDNFLITDRIQRHNERHSYNSLATCMPKKNVYKFLQDSGVI
jgi:FlaA1/EpsC-like NDP-sugar epimerase